MAHKESRGNLDVAKALNQLSGTVAAGQALTGCSWAPLSPRLMGYGLSVQPGLGTGYAMVVKARHSMLVQLTQALASRAPVHPAGRCLPPVACA